jgi:hypothetical protein
VIVDYHMHLRVDRALDLLREIGYETVTVYEGRKARQEPLG